MTPSEWFEKVQAELAPFDTDERFTLVALRSYGTLGGCYVGWYATDARTAQLEYGNALIKLPTGHQAIWGSLADQVKADYERSTAAGTTVRAAYP